MNPIARCFECKKFIEPTSDHAVVLTMATARVNYCGWTCLGRYVALVEKRYRDKLDEAGE